ncbi:flavin reductase [Saccharopolyspora sp. HNM0983]|uniref:Flavin reductase n=1 Tax=Saccharopolyspora montiporae TaxID=2781240 RepID=A0A929B6U3_9PSEU|nr:flavin reductase [Saccharopolyspora sp. HNM0983]MBE9372895.1 flavin reductase [Saccharopolyspora sp. HNM0983]
MHVFDSNTFRRVLGSFPTGVVVITATGSDGEALAMTVGSFMSVSLDPPLVGFLPSKTSSSWAAIRASGKRFGVNVLSNTQEDVCRAVAKRKTDKLVDFEWSRTEYGTPKLAESIAFIDCETESVYDGGDHEIVIGRVLALESMKTTLPLLFFRGGYGSFRPGSMAVESGIPGARLAELDVVRPHLERLSRHLSLEVTAMCRIDENLVTVAAAGTSKRSVRLQRVGRQVPFMPPIGGVFAAFGGPEAETEWLDNVHHDFDGSARQSYEQALNRVREAGFAVGIGHDSGKAIEGASVSANEDGSPHERRRLARVISDASEGFNTHELRPEEQYEFHSMTAPVFDADGACAFSLTVWGARGTIPGPDVLAIGDKLIRAAESCTADLQRAGRSR